MGCSKSRVDSGLPSRSKRGEAARVEFIKKHGEWGKFIDNVGIWTPGNVKDFVVFYKYLEETGITIDDVQDWIAVEDADELGHMEEKQRDITEFIQFQNQRFGCPECGYHLTYMPVNTTASTMVGGNYTYLIFCGNRVEHCLWEHYIRGSIPNWVRGEKQKRAEALKDLKKEIIRKDESLAPVTAIHKDSITEAEERIGKIIRKRKKEQEENAKKR
jgi:hypothetical protein